MSDLVKDRVCYLVLGFSTQTMYALLTNEEVELSNPEIFIIVYATFFFGYLFGMVWEKSKNAEQNW